MMIYWTLFYEFFKIGLFSIGGGLATLPFLYDLADKYTWFDAAKLSDMIAVSQAAPGPFGVNMATYTGFQVAGIQGGIIAVTALVLPSLISIIIIAKFIDQFSDNVYVVSVFQVVRPVVTALIVVAGLEVFKVSVLTLDQFQKTNSLQSLFNYKALILFVLILYLSNKFKLHPVVYIIAAAVIGVVFKL